MSRLERVTGGLVLGFLGVKCAVLASNLVVFPVLGDRPPPAAGGEPTGADWATGRVSLLLPARDEEVNLRRTLHAFVDQPADELLVLDDGSTDGTSELVLAAAASNPRVRLVPGAALPPGWTGKNWACHQLARAATGDLLVFCDADVTLAPGALAAVRAEAERQDADLFSVFPRQQTGTLGERVLVPLIDDVLLCLLPHGLLRAPVPAAATANGQLLAFRRSAYDALGGHEVVRSAVVEDVRLAVRTRAAGRRLGLALGGDLVGVRMYDSYGAAVAGLGKSLLPAHGGSRLLLSLVAAWHVVAYTLPWVRLGLGPRRTVAGLAAALGLLERLGVNAKTGRGDWWEAALVPAAPVAALPVYARAVRRTSRWKGRDLR